MDKLAENIVHEIIKELCGRSGFDDWWEQLDYDTQMNIEWDLKSIIIALLLPLPPSPEEE